MENALNWKSYSVRAHDKEPLLRFITRALEMRHCKVLFASEPNRAPFYIVFETPNGARHGLLAYAFFANAKETKNRPKDEHRFQVKYGSNLETEHLEVAVDRHQLVTTIFLGIDTERGLFVAADPLMNSPAPMSRSIEFKASHVDEILRTGWCAWERDRNRPKSKDRPSFYDEDLRTEILIGGKQERLLDLVALERLATSVDDAGEPYGLDPGERHLLADRLRELPQSSAVGEPHPLLSQLGVTSESLLDLIQNASRLKMAVRGWVAETKLVDQLQQVSGVTECARIQGDGQPDVSLR